MKKRKFLKINTLKELALQLKLPQGFLFDMATKINENYTKFTDIDKKGKEREFFKVSRSLELIHKKINHLLDRIDYPISIQGGIVGRSIWTNASIHSGKLYVANFDIKNFFPSIDYHMIYNVFLSQKCAPGVARTLTRLTTTEGCLPQGFATSPKISGLVLFNINRRLSNLLSRYALKHSFWIDDLTISGNYPITKIKNLVYKMFQQEGFFLHDDPEKAMITNFKERQTCTGLVVNQEPNVKKSTRKEIRKELFLCIKFGAKNFLKEHSLLIDEDAYLKSLAGKISFLCGVNKKNLIFREQFKKINI